MTTCEAVRYAPTQPCSDTPPKHAVRYFSTDGRVIDHHPACFTHGLAEVDRHATSGGIARADLAPADMVTDVERQPSRVREQEALDALMSTVHSGNATGLHTTDPCQACAESRQRLQAELDKLQGNA